jgi:CubicO group peptidase (beta-lactamase class C family)
MTPGMTTAFEQRYGFPRRAVRLENWRTRPYCIWSFQNVSELVPSAQVSSAAEAEQGEDPSDILALTLDLPAGRETVSAFLERSFTDSLVVMKRGRFVADYRAPTCEPASPHLVFSIGKSLTALLAGTLEDEGKLDPSAPVTRYVPDAAGSAYGDASVRDVMDMRVSLDFDEAYTDPESIFARYRRSMLWNPGPRGQTLREFVLSLRKGPGPHGGPFRYQSPNSDMLGLIVEAASGERYADLLKTRIWEKVGCKGHCMVSIDAEGNARGAGGVSITARDLARIGEMLRNGGMAAGRVVLSERWVRDTTTGGDRQAWKDGDFAKLLENGSYRSKWYQSGYASGAFMAIGIHGQWLYVDPSAEVVIVKQSSQHLPVDDPLDHETLRLLRTIAERV